MPDLKLIAPSDLLLDPENARLEQPNVGQREALRALAKLLDTYLVVLAADIVRWGLDLSTLPIVMQSGDDAGRYIVLEGNRRLAALKVLENPDSIVGAVPAATVADLKELSKQYQNSPIESVRCLVVKERSEADHWIELRHTGRNDGAGILTWGSDESSRFKARSGEIPIHTQALNFLEGRGAITSDKRRGKWVTNLKRLLDTPEVREKFGLSYEGGELRVLGKPAHVEKALMHVVNELTSGKTKVGKIYTKEQRLEYIKKLPPGIAVTIPKAAGKLVARFIRLKLFDYFKSKAVEPENAETV